MTHSYEQDFYAWTQEQAHLLRAGNLLNIDINHLAEEIEDMGRSEKRTLSSRLEILLIHLLKWQFQPTHRGNSWQLTICEQRIRLAEHLADNPSLWSALDERLGKSYKLAILGAGKETGMNNFPPICPYTIEQILQETFFPE